MKRILLAILLALAIAANAATPELSPPVLAPLQQHAQAANITAQIVAKYHYKAAPLDQPMSERIFDRYLAALDSERVFFVQADIDRFAGERSKLGEAIQRQDLRIPFEIFNLYERRGAERFAYVRELLRQDFDFRQHENYQYARDKEPWAKSEDEVRDLWRKRVKNEWLRLKLAGKDAKAIRDTLDKRYGNSLARALKSTSDDVFQIFMNAFTTSIEPHTGYLGLKASEDFDISMSLSLVGIGAMLQQKDEYTTIRELVPGGPAALSAKLDVGDRIVGIGQGSEGALTDVVGWRVDDVVRLVRGAKDSVVRLDVLPAESGPDAKHKRVTLVRNKISLEQQAARKSIIQVKDGATTRQVGVISLPAFYQDLDARRKGEKEYRSAARDVARLLDELKQDKIDVLLVDLRNNGGGSLDEAVQLTGLFTGKGPVVQQRDSRGKVTTESGNNPKPGWTGPLGVLINRGSASASEIFAAAIQDYARGVVIGEPSYGKGTVQTMLNLDKMAKNDKPKFGGLKMTVAQFFRVNGGTTQLRGVTPDISFPSASDPDSFGESSFDNALPWTEIKAALYTPSGDVDGMLPLLQSRHAARVALDKDFQYLKEDSADLKARGKKHLISLNEAERRAERDMREARLKSWIDGAGAEGNSKRNRFAMVDTAPGKTGAGQDGGLEPEDLTLGKQLAAEKIRMAAKDVWLNEAANILGDQVGLLRNNVKFAARAVSANP